MKNAADLLVEVSSGDSKVAFDMANRLALKSKPHYDGGSVFTFKDGSELTICNSGIYSSSFPVESLLKAVKFYHKLGAGACNSDKKLNSIKNKVYMTGNKYCLKLNSDETKSKHTVVIEL